MGGACSVGDQLHPRGRLEPATYQLIGQAYAQVEKVEDRVSGTQAPAEIGIVWSESTSSSAGSGKGLTLADRGAFRMCLEEHLFSDFVDLETDLSPYRVLILPDKVRLTKPMADKLTAYLKKGGALICSGESGLNQDGDEFLLPIPLTVNGPAEFCPEFIAAGKELNADLPDAPIVMYLKGMDVKPRKKVLTLADAWRPYFNREAGLFCSHLHWPPQGPAGRPAVIQSGNIIYFAYPIFEAYGKYASRHYKQLVVNAIDRLMPQRILRSNLPSTAQVELVSARGRQILTILHYVPENRSAEVATIEEALPLIDIHADLAVAGRVKNVKVLLGDVEGLTWTSDKGKCQLEFSNTHGKLMLELET